MPTQTAWSPEQLHPDHHELFFPEQDVIAAASQWTMVQVPDQGCMARFPPSSQAVAHASCGLYMLRTDVPGPIEVSKPGFRMVNWLVWPLGFSLCIRIMEGLPLLDLEFVRFADTLRSFRTGTELASRTIVLLVRRIPVKELLHWAWVAI